MTIAKPVFPWVGGKEKLAPYIHQVLPPKSKQFLDPFGGCASVLLGLPPDAGRLDIYNDLDADLSNFMLCIRDKTNALMRESGFLPIHSRVVFQLYKQFMAHKDIHWEVYEKNLWEELEVLEDRSCFTSEQAEELRPILEQRAELFDVERASIFYKSVRGSFSGTVTTFGVRALRLYRFLYLISEAGRRLEDVAIEHKDAIQLIRERDRADGVIYCDPPYWGAERMYRVTQKRGLRRFHVRLWQVLMECKGYVVLSYNDCPFIRKLYQDFYILALRRPNSLVQKPGAEYGELVITNYDPRPYLSKQLTLFDGQTGEWEMELVHIPKKPLKIIE